jgi:hypothetical protein
MTRAANGSGASGVWVANDDIPAVEECQNCGAPVRVQVLKGYRAGRPVVRFLCMDCADRVEELESAEASTRTRQRLSVRAMLVIGGLGLGLVAMLGKQVELARSGAFSVEQRLTVCLGAFLVVLGALLRVDVVGVIGTVLFAVALGAGLLHLINAAQAGFLPAIEMILSLVLIGVGLSIRRRTL